jgi:hypothetical protein
VSDEMYSKVYSIMCSNCINAKKCHEECTTCEDFEEKMLEEGTTNE